MLPENIYEIINFSLLKKALLKYNEGKLTLLKVPA
jgi:hypothetical protein